MAILKNWHFLLHEAFFIFNKNAIKLEKMPFFVVQAIFKMAICRKISFWGILSPKIGVFFRSDGLATLLHTLPPTTLGTSPFLIPLRRPPPLLPGHICLFLDWLALIRVPLLHSASCYYATLSLTPMLLPPSMWSFVFILKLSFSF